MNDAAVEEKEEFDVLKEKAFHTEELSTKEQRQMAARSDMYALLADLFRYPDEEFREFVKKGEMRESFLSIVKRLPFDLSLSEDDKKDLVFSDKLSDDEIEAGFIRIFEAGPGDPACPLVEGKHVKDSNRRAIFEDLIRFYNHFGLSYDQGSHEDRPDHISYEMEFMHYLAFLTVRAIQAEKDPHDLLLAQRDFLEHHLLKWADKLSARAKEVAAELENDYVGKFYANIASLLARYVAEDHRYIDDRLTA